MLAPSERRIQEQLYRYLMVKQHHQMSPNVYLFDWEADLLSLTKAGYIHEYEIKISRSDFMADSKKVDKHQALKNGWRDLVEYETFRLEQYRQHPRVYKPEFLKNLTPEDKHRMSRPNYFWYVCPTDLIRAEDVPEHAGLMYVNNRDWHAASVVKPAPKLHKEPATAAQVTTLLVSLEWRYWRLRLKEPDIIAPIAVAE